MKISEIDIEKFALVDNTFMYEDRPDIEIMTDWVDTYIDTYGKLQTCLTVDDKLFKICERLDSLIKVPEGMKQKKILKVYKDNKHKASIKPILTKYTTFYTDDKKELKKPEFHNKQCRFLLTISNIKKTKSMIGTYYGASLFLNQVQIRNKVKLNDYDGCVFD